MTDSHIFANKDGSYNTNYFGYIQIFGPAPTTGDVPAKVFESNFLGRLSDKFQRATGNRQPDLFAKIRAALDTHKDKLWSAHNMSGAEYERGRYLAYAASRLSQNTMAAKTITLDVGFDVLPTKEAERYIGKENMVSLRERMKKDGIKLPETAKVDIHIIAPKGKLNTAVDMLRVAAAEKGNEQATHRGFGFARAVAEMVSGTQSQDNMKKTTGWFDIYEGTFIFIDRKQFEVLANAIGVAVPKVATVVTPRAPRP